MINETNYQISLLTAMNNRLEKDESMYRMLCQTSENAFMYYNYAEKRTVFLGNWSRFFPFTAEEYKSVSQILECVEESCQSEVYNCLMPERNGVRKATTTFKMKDKSYWIELETNVSYDEMQQPAEKILCFKDITKFKIQNDELSYMAYYDSMTGLLNRNCFISRLRAMIERAEESRNMVSVLFIDIDGFRKINDGMGMMMGDEIVQLFGQRLKGLEEEKIIISHFNSDIFCIGVYDPCGSRSVEHIIDTLKSNLAEPFNLSNGAEVTLTASIGIAEYPESSKEALELINCAEIVMFKAKHKGKNVVQYFDSPIIQEFRNNVIIERKLDKALKNQHFFMCYQPQYHTDNCKLRGVEALVRWKDEEGNIISPGTFIPLAEKNGAILPLGDWIMEESIAEFTNWYRKYGFEDVILSLNISALQFKNRNFVSHLLRVIDRYKIPTHLLELEITESVFIEDMQDIINKMNILRELGIRFSMDDFGTGFSSLSYLRNLPIDTLKIDKSFIDTLVTDEPTRTIAETIIDLSKKLGFNTIAEGVEDEVQYSLLKKIGCENIQGFYLGKPMEGKQIESMLSDMVS